MHFLTLTPLLFALPALSNVIFTDFPHLIIPLDKNQPNTPLGTLPYATVGNTIWTEISFDVRPYKDSPANICRINFHVNTNAIKNAPKELKGDAPYTFQVIRLDPTMDKNADTWFSHPYELENWATATITVSPDWKVDVEGGWFECPFGNVAQFVMRPSFSNAFSYSWFELDYPGEQGGPHGVTIEYHT